MARQIGMFSVRFPDGQFGSELINGPEMGTQTFPTGLFQATVYVEGGVFLKVCIV